MVTLAGQDFTLADFKGLGHSTILAAIPELGIPAEPRFPDRIFRMFLLDAGKNAITTSTSSHTVGTGSKVFTLAEERTFTGFVTITDNANSENNMHGLVTAQSGTSLTVNVTSYEGSGTKTDWSIQISGPRGPEGEAGDMLASVYDPAEIEEQVVGLTAAQNLSNKTYEDVEGYHAIYFNRDGTYIIYLSAQVAETLTALKAISTDSGTTFNVSLELAGVETASLSSVDNTIDSTTSFSDATITVGQKLAVVISGFSGSGAGEVYVHSTQDLVS